MKKIAIIILILYTAVIHSQQITISMSIEWKQEELYFDSLQGSYKVPYLIISYSNNTKTSYYICDNSHTYAPKMNVFAPAELINYGGNPIPDLTDDVFNSLKQNLSNKSNLVFYPDFYPKYTYSFNWFVLGDNEYMKREEVDWNINNYNDKYSYIGEIFIWYNSQKELNKIDSTKQLIGFNYHGKEKITYNNYVSSYYEQIQSKKSFDEYKTLHEVDSVLEKDYYIFLPPQGKHTVEYTLAPLMLLDVEYRFELPKRKMNNSVLYDYEYDFKKNKASYKTYKLPRKLNGYTLYDKTLNAYSVSLSIEK